MLIIKKIIEEADIRVPNSFSIQNKIDWLNEVNQEFFEIVKIPKIQVFKTIAGQKKVTLTNTDIRAKNIAGVRIGNVAFLSILYDIVNPGNNWYSYDEQTRELTISTEPQSEENGILKYYRIAETSFTNENDTPDAPPEYHWIYIIGLCERIAKTMNDVSLANNYANDYMNNLQVIKQKHERVEVNDS